MAKTRTEELEQDGTPDVPVPKQGDGRDSKKSRKREQLLEKKEAEREAEERARAMEHPLCRPPRVRPVKEDEIEIDEDDEPWVTADNPALFVGEIDDED